MPSLADLEGLFAGSYALRLPIAVGVVGVAVLLGILAVRGRWDRAVVRHPIAGGAIGTAVLVVGLPLAWYLGSPLIISTELVEPAPVAAASSIDVEAPGSVAPTVGPSDVATSRTTDSPTAAPSSEALSSPATMASPSAAGPAAAATETRGSFSGTDDFHFGRGTARLIVAADGSAILRFEDFSVRNGPDLFVYLSPSATRYTKSAIELGRLKADRGSFNYKIPPGTDLSKVNSAIIWCKQFSFQFAVAPLS